MIGTIISSLIVLAVLTIVFWLLSLESPEGVESVVSSLFEIIKRMVILLLIIGLIIVIYLLIKYKF